jgi:hypothetical protein
MKPFRRFAAPLHFAILGFLSLQVLLQPSHAGVAERYIDAQLEVALLTERALEPAILAAEASADRLVKGGGLYLAGEPGMVAEVYGRAGGPCGALQLPLDKPLPALGSRDVILLSDYGRVPGKLAAAMSQLSTFGGVVVVFVPQDHSVLRSPAPDGFYFVPVAVPQANEVLVLASGERLLPTVSPAMTTVMWTYVAELIGACRRRDRQLAIYLSTFLDPGRARYARTRGLLFEPDFRPQPVGRGEYARAFLEIVKGSLASIRAHQLPRIRTGASWLRDSIAGQNQRVRSLIGHLPPLEAGLPGDVTFFTHTQLLMGEKGEAWIRATIREGDTILLLAYRDEDPLSKLASSLGARTIAISSAGPGEEQARDPRHLYIDPYWPITDACLPLEGYDVKACPLSTILNLTLYFAVCGEVVAPN